MKRILLTMLAVSAMAFLQAQEGEIIYILGQQVLSVQGNGNELRIDMATLPTGIYFVTVTDEEGRKCVRKVVKE